ncbi:MAG TPA: exonuclease domain-containing protein [Alphaproteobacteria bacterium]
MSIPDRTRQTGSERAAQLAPRYQFAVLAAIAAVFGFAVFAAMFALRAGPETADILAHWAAGLAALVTAGLIWLGADHLVFRPLGRLAARARLAAAAASEARIDAAAYPTLAPLPDALDQLVSRYLTARREVQQSVASATRRVEEQKERLEAILRDLSEGVMVCNLDHQVLLYNHVALALLHVSGELGLGRSLFNLISRAPVLHALERLLQRPAAGPEESTLPVVCATTDSRTLLRGRMSLVLDTAGTPTGYVLTFADVTREIAELSRRDTLLRRATEGLRAPIANLRAAAETISFFPDISPEQRRAFEDVILREGNVLSERLEALDRDYRSLSASHWPMTDIHSVDLFSWVVRNLRETGGPQVTMVGLPLWLHGDSHSLSHVLECILRKLAVATRADTFDIEALLGDRRVYIQITWAGDPISSATLDDWSDEPLPAVLGSPSLRDVLTRHGSEMWSHAQQPGRAALRIPLPAPIRVQFAPTLRPEMPSRPEFYDFDLFQSGAAARSAVSTPLRSAAYVAFDTETTGLRPSQGDELVAIGAVRIVNGRILTGETFNRLVNPGRPIPPDSVRFHGITDAMVADAPPAELVLPQFKAFVADAVLVAHNAAFDLTFLQRKQEASGIRFDSVTLDTLLISAFLFPEFDDHSLDTIAGRLGIAVSGRHTALGDAMATAAIFVRMLDLLEARGIVTIGHLLEASKMALAIRMKQAAF